MDVSYDGTNWINDEFYEYGNTTIQTTHNIAADGWVHLWLDPDTVVKQVRMLINATNTSASNITNITSYLIGMK